MSIRDGAMMWLASGERCAASETLFTYCAGQDALSDWGEDHPRSAEDFRRCRLVFEMCPELRSCLPRVAYLSKQWAEFVSFWDDLCLVHDLEDPDWPERAGPSPRLASMINALLERCAPVTA